MSKDENQIENSNNDSKPSFWKHNNTISIATILITLIPSIMILINFLDFFNKFGKDFNPGFEMANSIALFAASIAVSGTFYSNYRNDILNKRQIAEAENRLDKQLTKQEEQLEIQLDKQDERLKDQLIAAKENLKEQLDHNEKQLETQLIFNEERRVMLKIYNILYQNRESIYNKINDIKPENTQNYLQEWNDELGTVITSRYDAYGDLDYTQRDIDEFYYIPLPIRDKILEFSKYIDNNMEKYKSLPQSNGSYRYSDFSRKVFYDDDNQQTEKYLKELYELVENYIQIPIKR